MSWLTVTFAKPFYDLPTLVRAEAMKQLSLLASRLRASEPGSPLRQRYAEGGIHIDIGGWRFVHRLAGDRVVVDDAFLVNGSP